MKVKAIYDAALSFLGGLASEDENDLAERAPYIVAAFCSDAEKIDRDYRETHRLGVQPDFGRVYIALDEEFPLCRRFATSAAYYLAAMLIFDENETASDDLFSKYCDSLARAISEVPFGKEKITNAYSV